MGPNVVRRVFGGEHVITTAAYAEMVAAIRTHRYGVELDRRSA
ncbi:hypothetical protein [Streptomyces sp. H27-H1]|nr:hypothetical protein [Streptomyces sp. H27-H1]